MQRRHDACVDRAVGLLVAAVVYAVSLPVYALFWAWRQVRCPCAVCRNATSSLVFLSLLPVGALHPHSSVLVAWCAHASIAPWCR